MSGALLIAIDFDNTIISYDSLIHGLALDSRLIDASVGKNKTAVRDHIRGLPNGEQHWQKIQAAAYGPEMAQAQPAEGVQDFLSACSEHNCRVYIVSHKTEYAAQDNGRTNLRAAAMDWLSDHHFFGSDGLGLTQDNVFFEDTRIDKLNRVNSLGCSHFIDDLEETFLEEGVPLTMDKILYAPHGTQRDLPGVKQAANWREVTDYVFNDID
ncbi:MAG: hypothetical protein FI731_05620 [SAR202 cluster bacterium]|nr:hypothetical protein [SAR202 cluster bacterium]